MWCLKDTIYNHQHTSQNSCSLPSLSPRTNRCHVRNHSALTANMLLSSLCPLLNSSFICTWTSVETVRLLIDRVEVLTSHSTQNRSSLGCFSQPVSSGCNKLAVMATISTVSVKGAENCLSLNIPVLAVMTGTVTPKISLENYSSINFTVTLLVSVLIFEIFVFIFV